MKTILFFSFMLINFNISFSQDCNININPIPPHKDFDCSKSVGIPDFVEFYSFPDSSNHLLFRTVLSDVFRRVTNSGDSAIITLKNNHKIKLINLRQFNYRQKQMNLVLSNTELYPVTFLAWISKEDVKQMTTNSIKDERYFIPIEENNFVKDVLKPNKQNKLYFQPTMFFTHKKRVLRLANCALNL
jgi:hypothetical protein